MAGTKTGGPRKRGAPRNDQKQLIAERRKEALRLQANGATLPMIVAANIGYTSPQHVHQDLQRYYREVPAPARNFYVQQQQSVIAQLIAINMAAIGRTKVNTKGERVPLTTPKQDMERTDRVVRLLARQAKLLGLDAPTRIDVDAHVTSDLGKMIDGMSPADWDYIIEHDGKLPPTYARMLEQKTVDDSPSATEPAADDGAGGEGEAG